MKDLTKLAATDGVNKDAAEAAPGGNSRGMAALRGNLAGLARPQVKAEILKAEAEVIWQSVQWQAITLSVEAVPLIVTSPQ